MLSKTKLFKSCATVLLPLAAAGMSPASAQAQNNSYGNLDKGGDTTAKATPVATPASKHAQANNKRQESWEFWEIGLGSVILLAAVALVRRPKPKRHDQPGEEGGRWRRGTHLYYRRGGRLDRLDKD